MNPVTLYRTDILKMLARYEDAYKRSLTFAKLNSGCGVVDLSSPLYEMVRYYKNKINELRKKLRST